MLMPSVVRLKEFSPAFFFLSFLPLLFIPRLILLFVACNRTERETSASLGHATTVKNPQSTLGSPGLQLPMLAEALFPAGQRNEKKNERKKITQTLHREPLHLSLLNNNVNTNPPRFTSTISSHIRKTKIIDNNIRNNN